MIGQATLAAPPDATAVLAAAAENYSTQYARRVERLLNAMLEPLDEAVVIETRIELVVSRMGKSDVELIEDGATLRDNDDASASDKLKVRLTVSRGCYVYAVGIDASGAV